MKKDSSFAKLLTLFFTFMKIGAFTFGGGYAMIPIIEEEVAKKHRWISSIDLLDIIAISESTPGPIAVNIATYVGYKIKGIWGAIFATLGLAIPSFLIIFIISFFYKEFIKWKWVEAIFKGLKVGVILLLIKAILKLGKDVKVTGLGIFLFVLAIGAMLAVSIFDIAFRYTSLCLILLGIIIGVVTTIITNKKGDNK